VLKLRDLSLPQADGSGDRRILGRFADSQVLVIDDNPSNVALLRALLTRAGLRAVHTATDPRDALSRIDEIDPDLVLLDLHMPELDGYAVLQMLTQRAAGSYLPVMVLTADSTPEANERALNLGARDFLSKPLQTNEVLLRVRNLLETRDLHVTLRRQNMLLREQLGGYQEFHRTAEEARQLLHQQIARVIAEGDIRIVYQPVFDLRSGKLLGVEALSRFPSDPSRTPDRWFSEANEVGLGVALELSAIRGALPALEALPESMFLAVNVSPSTVLSREIDLVCEKQPTSRLVLELTEHVPVEDYEAVNLAVSSMRASGARLAVDDTGAGYAGFRHLLGLKPDIVKLDISLTRGVDQDPARRALASALVRFTEDTGADLIAEGIETADELHALRELEVGCAQGFYLGRPQQLPRILDLAHEGT
jgi:EAL domain-containing protein (putative c-di-GMP-specific phosphodiesterase class I)